MLNDSLGPWTVLSLDCIRVVSAYMCVCVLDSLVSCVQDHVVKPQPQTLTLAGQRPLRR